jgi:hypothetical protein
VKEIRKKRLHELSSEEFEREMEELRPLLRRADHEASCLLAEQLQELDEAETKAPRRSKDP